MFAPFAQHLADQDRSPGTIKKYMQHLAAFAAWFTAETGDELTPLQITASVVGRYRTFISAQVNPASVNLSLSAIRAYVAWAVEVRLIKFNPIENVKGIRVQRRAAPRRIDGRGRFRFMREFELAMNAATTEAATRKARRNNALAVMLLNTGLRVSELCALNVSDVKIGERSGSVLVKAGKGIKSRAVPMNLTARQAVSKWLEVRPHYSDADALFVGQRGERMTAKGVWAVISGAGRRAGVRVSPHRLRHTFARALLETGTGIEAIADLLGHADIQTTRIYTQPDDDDFQQAVSRIES